MGLFGKLFEKKECDFCGGEIGMLGNRKLEDGNMCKECAKKLSPWFDDRRHSTVEQIQQQLEMREANKQAVAAFRDTTVLGKSTHRIYIDEGARKFMVCREKERGDNPDVFDFSQVTSVIVDIDEDRDEKYQTDGDGDRRSYYPPRYTYHYDIRVIIYLNHPYVDDIRFDINASRISTTLLGQAVPENMKPNPRSVKEFMDCEQIAMKIKGILEGGNFQQPAAMYNRKIAPVRGLKVRGIIWYQGENEVGVEWSHRIYANALRVYHRYYTELFAADPASFPMISSLLYPWVYGNAGECMRAYVNEAFVKTAKESPDKFIICPIDDLPPVWAANLENHPIHPAHKYRLGARMAKLALTNVYGQSGQRAPATLDSYEIDGNRLILKFADVGCGLYIKDGHIDGLYIAGENRHYLPAECEILSADTMAVWHPYLENPVHAAYDISSFACGANLWAGEYPAAPFATDIQSQELIRLESMPFLNPDLVSVWETRMNPSQQPLEVYYFPIWKALPESPRATRTPSAFRAVAIRSAHMSAQPSIICSLCRSSPPWTLISIIAARSPAILNLRMRPKTVCRPPYSVRSPKPRVHRTPSSGIQQI